MKSCKYTKKFQELVFHISTKLIQVTWKEKFHHMQKFFILFLKKKIKITQVFLSHMQDKLKVLASNFKRKAKKRKEASHLNYSTMTIS